MQAAEQPAARPGDLHRVQRQALGLSQRQAHRSSFGQPARDAQLPPAAPDPVQPLGFVARPDLPQLDPRAEQACEVPHQRPEIHALLGGEVNRELALVPLPFGVGDLHGEIVLPHAVPYGAAHFFFIASQIGGRLPIFRCGDPKNSSWRGAVLTTTRATPLTLLLSSTT